MEMPFGRKIRVGNFEILKYTKTLPKKELKAMRDAAGIPADVQKHLQRGWLPFIKATTISGSWSVEWICGSTMFNAINELPVAVDDNNVPQYYGNGYKNLYAILVAMFADTSTVGDTEYQVAKQKLLNEYLERASEAMKQEPTEQEQKESEEAADEVLQTEQHKAMLLDMGKDVADDRQND